MGRRIDPRDFDDACGNPAIRGFGAITDGDLHRLANDDLRRARFVQWNLETERRRIFEREQRSAWVRHRPWIDSSLCDNAVERSGEDRV